MMSIIWECRLFTSLCYMLVLLFIECEPCQAAQSSFRKNGDLALHLAHVGKPNKTQKNPPETVFSKMRRIWAPSLSDEEHDYERLETACNTPVVADSSFNPNARCPKECPFFAEDHEAKRFCTFQCVTADKCADHDPQKPIADEELGVCRASSVGGCQEPMIDGTDRCTKCEIGFDLQLDGTCHYHGTKAMIIFSVVLGIVVALLVIWIVDICCRPISNPDALEAGMLYREDRKVKFQRRADGGVGHTNEITISAQKSIDEDGEEASMMGSSRQPSSRALHIGFASQQTELSGRKKEYYPLNTNLCSTDVIGPGATLHFNFQAVIIVWVLLMAAGWLLLGIVVDADIFVLGSRKLGTPAQNCFTVAWGFETQHRLMWCKVLYLWIAYVSSTVLAFIHSIRQMRIFRHYDDCYKNMQDYALMIEGLPELKGDKTVDGESLENYLKMELKKQLGVEPVGVSIAWNFQDQTDEVEYRCNQMRRIRNPIQKRQEDDATGPRKMLKALETQLFLNPTEEGESHEDVIKLLKNLTTSRNAFVIFETEADRSQAMQKGGICEFEGSSLSFVLPRCEPTTVLWSNFCRSTILDTTWRCFKGCCRILGFLTLWFVFFYVPYAWSIYHFNYDNGRQPGAVYSLAFSMIVVLGNNIMYNVCEVVSSRIGFRFKDDKEASYLVFYTIACTLQVLLDMVTTYHSAWYITKGLGFKTYDGRPLSEVDMFPEGFETYAIQWSLSENTYEYAFPSTFLTPFVLEPFVSILLPLILEKVIVRTHKDVTKAEAEDALAPIPLDMTRYGDILLDVVIFIMMLYFPGAYTARLGIVMALCHVGIYLYDHWRVLRAVPNCTFASSIIDLSAQAMLAPCCGLMLSILVFKSNVSEPHAGSTKTHSWSIIMACTAAFVLHCIVHLLLLVYAVPLFKKKHQDFDTKGKYTYRVLEERVTVNWFNANPVHCLRSKYLHKDDRPCMYIARGHE